MVKIKRVKVIVFDFDGTLIQSNELKHKAYFELFPNNPVHEEVIQDVLSECFEESRYVILEKILERLGFKGNIRCEVSGLAQQYNDVVTTGAKTCPEIMDAEEAVKVLSTRYKLYLNSTTPEESLKEILTFRDWDKYFQGVFGYPRLKEESLLEIMEKEKVSPQEILVVGDGYSDLLSARKIGCRFAKTNPEQSLYERIRLEIIK